MVIFKRLEGLNSFVEHKRVSLDKIGRNSP
jgi:hypothetical protein